MYDSNIARIHLIRQTKAFVDIGTRENQIIDL